MQGFQAISAANGWAMAIVGALIVFAGLSVLSAVISQLHKIITLFEKIPKNQKKEKTKPEKQKKLNDSDNIIIDINEIVNVYQPLVNQLGKVFELAHLYSLARERNIPHPHLAITRLRDEKFLISQGNGLFVWNQI